jgi:tetratricopeptide (TPR) repeat protein
MTSPFWPLEKLDELLNHPDRSIQQWAVKKLFLLHPLEAARRLPQLLDAEKPAVVLESLEQLEDEHWKDVIPQLSEIYLTGSETISSRAIQILGHLKFDGTVDLIKKKIIEKKKLGSEQIAAMIHALGQIQGDEAYDLLKQAEASVQEKEYKHWEHFYAALLEHRKVEDAQKVLGMALEPDLDEEHRRQALGLILGLVDPGLNPSNVMFLNHPEIKRHWRGRLDLAMEHRTEAVADTGPTDSLRELVEMIAPELPPEAIDLMRKTEEQLANGPYFELGIAQCARSLLQQTPGKDEWGFGLSCVFVSAAIFIIESRLLPSVQKEADWREKIKYLLMDRPPRAGDEGYEAAACVEAEPRELASILTSVLEADAKGWSALRAVEMLGRMKAVEAATLIVRSLSRAKDELFMAAVRKALFRMGVPVVPSLLPLLDSPDPEEKFLALHILGEIPIAESVQAIWDRVDALYAEMPERLLDAVYSSGARNFLPFIEKEYRRGEYQLGKVYVHLCKVNQLKPAGLREIERMVQQVETAADEQRRILSGEKAHWPTTVQLELSCSECGRKYNYEIEKVHLHPHVHDDAEGPGSDMTPYRHGIVICDDLRCKNCSALNGFKLTGKTYAQLTTESVKILAFSRAGLNIPANYPVQHVQLGEKDGKPLTLSAVEEEHLSATELTPTKPGVHLALGKFYEYIKEYSKARSAYLKTVDLDSRAVEAMAGLARLSHAEGDLEAASQWIQQCYENLDKGNLFLTEDKGAFKKAVRQKRSEYARDAGKKPLDDQVRIRFSIDTPDYPKNKPCPCGSGKKYKLCCMKD